MCFLYKMEFENIETLLMHMHNCLKDISIQNIGENDVNKLEGNIYTYNGQDTADFMKAKMKNLFYLAKECRNDILEIGFNAGNSVLIFLLANPTTRVHAIDIGIHSYLQPCVDYLNENFDNRVILHKGDSLNIIPNLPRSLGQTIDLYHIDGWHALEGIQADMKNCYDLAENGSYLVVDDVNIDDIFKETKKYEKEKKITLRTEKIKEVPQHFPHLIYSYNKPDLIY